MTMITTRIDKDSLKFYTAQEKINLLDKYHCELVSKEEVECQLEQELLSYAADLNTTIYDAPVFAVFGVKMTKDSCMAFYLGGQYVTHGDYVATEDYTSQIAAAFQAYLDARAIYGLAVVKDGFVFLSADGNFSGREIEYSRTTGDGVMFSRSTFGISDTIGSVIDRIGDGRTIKENCERLQSSHFNRNIVSMNKVITSCENATVASSALPTAVLSLGPLSAFVAPVSAVSSLSSNGSQLQVTSVSGYFTLIYEFFNGAGSCLVPEFKAEILPGSDASLSSSWNVIGSSQDKTDFDDQILPSLSGTGASFTMDFYTQKIVPKGKPESFILRLSISETSAGISATDTKELSLNIPPPTIQVGALPLGTFTSGVAADVDGTTGIQSLSLQIKKSNGTPAILVEDGYVTMRFYNRRQAFATLVEIQARIGCDLGSAIVVAGDPETLTGNQIIVVSGRWNNLVQDIGPFFEAGDQIIDGGKILFDKIRHAVSGGTVDDNAFEIEVDVTYTDISGNTSDNDWSYFPFMIALDSYLTSKVAGSRGNLEVSLTYKPDFNSSATSYNYIGAAGIADITYGWQGSAAPNVLDSGISSIVEDDTVDRLAYIINSNGALNWVDIQSTLNGTSGLKAYCSAAIFNTNAADYDIILAEIRAPEIQYLEDKVLCTFFAGSTNPGNIGSTPGQTTTSFVTKVRMLGEVNVDGAEAPHTGSPTDPRLASIHGGESPPGFIDSFLNADESVVIPRYGTYIVEIEDTRDNGWKLREVATFKFTRH